MAADELSIDFTTEELLLLADRARVAAPVGLGTSSFEELPDEYRDVLRDQAQAALTARRVLTEADDGELQPVEAVAALLGVISEPALLTTASLERDGVVETRFYSAAPDLAVEHRPVATSVHRLIPFATRDLLARVLAYVDLRPAEPPPVSKFSVALSVLQATGDNIAAHDHHAAVEVLTQAGAPAESADAFVEALKAKRASASVTILYRPEEERVAGGQLTWLDAALKGLWITETGADELLEVRPATAEEIARELLSYLPQPFSERPSLV